MRQHRDLDPSKPGQPVRRIIRPVLAGSLLLCGSTAAGAQTVELRLRDESNRLPVAGAIVRLLRNDSVVVQVLSGAAGQALLPAAEASTYRIRVDRIGYSGFVTGPFELAAGAPFRMELLLPSQVITLPEIVVRTTTACDGQRGEGEAAAALWEEIRKALTANVLTQRTGAVELLLREFEREVSLTGRPVREWVYRLTRTTRPPFGSLAASNLVRVGFVYNQGDSAVFAAPDANLLLSDEFVKSHCFSAVAGQPNQVGLHFEPLRSRQVPEVAGTLWVNRLTGELRFLEFEYRNLPPALARSDLGGRVEFQRLSSGDWIVSNWFVRMPVMGSFERFRPGRSTTVIDRIINYVERGGRAEPWQPPGPIDGAVLLGKVIDPASGEGLPGASIAIEGLLTQAQTDSTGSFVLLLPVSGPRQVTIWHPRFSAAEKADVVLSIGDTTRMEVNPPPVAVIAREMCGERSVAAQGGVLGYLWNGSKRTLSGTTIKATWPTPTGESAPIRAVSDRQGRFALCRLPSDLPITVRLIQSGREVLVRKVRLDWREFRWMELVLPEVQGSQVR